jgi:hypothetical protein
MEKETHGHNEHCGKCHGAWGDMGGTGHWGHIAIKVLVALFIFWCGVQFGELKGIMHGGYSPYGGGYGGYGSGMMNVRY